MPSSNDPGAGITPIRTALHDLHRSLDAKLVTFAGYSLPLQFPEGIKAEHLHTRSHAGLFDVSHMGQIRIRGDEVERSFEDLVTGNITELAVFQQRYTVLTNPEGGIIDDLMIARTPEGLLAVVNAACKQDDFSYIKQSLGSLCDVEMLDDRALLALQGPRAADVLAIFNADIPRLVFMHGGHFQIDGIDCRIFRCGYTGEDGFEISVENACAERIARLLLESGDVRPIGLGARDSLRLEAGLCLYGHDIDQSTSPVEANVRWVIADKYRDGSRTARFPGAGVILEQLSAGVDRLLVGLAPEGKMPVREGSCLLDNDGKQVGHVTSGGYGPSFAAPVAMGYVARKYAEPGRELHVEIRKRSHTMRVARLPFVPHRYHKT